MYCAIQGVFQGILLEQLLSKKLQVQSNKYSLKGGLRVNWFYRKLSFIRHEAPKGVVVPESIGVRLYEKVLAQVSFVHFENMHVFY